MARSRLSIAMLTPAQKPRGAARRIFIDTSLCILCLVRQGRLAKRFLPLRTFVTPAAMEPVNRRNAGESQFERQFPPQGHHLLLVHFAEGAEELYAALGPAV